MNNISGNNLATDASVVIPKAEAEDLYSHFIFNAMPISEEPQFWSRNLKSNIILMLSCHKKVHKNRICLKVWSVELELKCDP